MRVASRATEPRRHELARVPPVADVHAPEGSRTPRFVSDAVCSSGQPLQAESRARFEPRFGYDFAKVRVHTDARAAESAQSLNALAYTVGSDIVFAPGLYRPHTTDGRRLLAHELTHVVQQSGAHPVANAISSPGEASEQEAERVASVVSAGQTANLKRGTSTSLIQRQGDFKLTMPSFGAQRPPLSLFPPGQEPHLHLDPWVLSYALLDPDKIREAILALDLSVAAQPAVLTLPAPTPSATGALPGAANTGPTTTPGASAPIVPRGAGPETPRPASAGDLLGAIMAVPAVRTEINKLRDAATDQLKRDWRGLSTGDKVAGIGVTALIASGAIAGIVSNNSARQFALRQIQGRNIPVPMVPGLSFQLNPIGPNQSVMLNLDLSTLARKLGM